MSLYLFINLFTKETSEENNCVRKGLEQLLSIAEKKRDIRFLILVLENEKPRESSR